MSDTPTGMDTLAAGGIGQNPLYKEVKIRLTRGLASGTWKPGEAIPSETRLASQFNVSIGTVRKAIDELVAERILVRQQGRGTFVAAHTPDRLLFYFFHIIGKDGSRERPVTELLSFRAGKSTAEEQEALQLERGASVLRVRNLLRLAGEPVIYDELTVPEKLFTGLTEEMLAHRDTTIYGLYQARWGINVVRISERLSAAAAPAKAAAELGLAPGTPTLLIRRVAYTYHDQPVEYRVSWVDTTRHEYLSDLWKANQAALPGYG
jgi:GntR family transcriptional regulator